MRDRNEDRAAGEAFWRFSLAFYGRPTVADALIALQDRAGRDVNLILFALWAGAVGGRILDAAALVRAADRIAPVNRAAVRPLRRLRRRLKPEADADLQALRRRIAGLELAAERLAQSRLAAADAADGAVPASARFAAAAANLALCLAEDAASPEAETLRRTLAGLLRIDLSDRRPPAGSRRGAGGLG